MIRSSHAAQAFAFVLTLSGLVMLFGYSVLSSSGAQSGSAAQPAEVVMSDDYILNKDGTLRRSHVTSSMLTMNELAFQHNEIGAEQAARHSIDLINYSWANGDTIALDEFSEERCTYCQTISERVHAAYDNGGRTHGVKFTTTQVEDNRPANTNSPETAQFIDSYILSLLLQRSKADRYAPPTLEHIPAGTGHLFVIAHWDGSEWKITGTEGKDYGDTQSR